MICFHTECRILFIIILNVIMLNVVMLSVVMLSVVMLSVVMLSVVMLSVIMLSVVMLNVVMLSVVMLSVVMLNVVMLSVVAPLLALKKLYGCPLAIADKDNRPVLNKHFTASNQFRTCNKLERWYLHPSLMFADNARAFLSGAPYPKSPVLSTNI